MYRLFFQKSKQPKLNIEQWVILSSSLPPTGLSPPCQMPCVSPMQMRRKPTVQGVQKKNVHTGLDREQPFSSPFFTAHSPAVLSPVVRHVRTSENGFCFPCLSHTDRQNPDTTRHWELDIEP